MQMKALGTFCYLSVQTKSSHLYLYHANSMQIHQAIQPELFSSEKLRYFNYKVFMWHAPGHIWHSLACAAQSALEHILFSCAITEAYQATIAELCVRKLLNLDFYGVHLPTSLPYLLASKNYSYRSHTVWKELQGIFKIFTPRDLLKSFT